MPAPLKEIIALNAKLDWAEEHIQDFQLFWSDFREKSYRVESKNDSKSGQRVYFLADAWDLNEEFSVRIGDIVHNLRSALDHLAYRAMNVSPGITAKNLQSVYFPIAETAAEYQSLKGRRVKGMRQDTVKAIDLIEPYGGGAGEILWHLHDLDIIDKHKLLIAVGSTSRQQSMPPSEIARLKREFLGIRQQIYTPAQEAILFQTARASIQFPLQRGDILAIIPEREVNEHMHFTFEVAFGEPIALRGEPVIAKLYEMSGRIRDIIRNFDNAGYLE